MDQLADLMLLADRYEVDSLKTACEHGLKAHIDHDSVLYFLSMGDQFNAKHLRVGNVKDYQYKWTADHIFESGGNRTTVHRSSGNITN